MSLESSSHIEPALLSLADFAAQRLGLGTASLDAGELVAEAERRAGRLLATRDIEMSLRVLVDACEREATLSVFGRFSLRWDAARRLAGLLRFEQEEDEDPDVLRAEVPAPIFVTGLPRSGTTFLHMLLALDPAFRAPLAWQTIYPYPDPRDGARDRRVRRVEREFQAFRRIAPGVEGLHPLAATTPQECTEITAFVFQSLRFDTTYYIPSYLQWLERRGHADAFRFHKRFLQHLQTQGMRGPDDRRGWVLKCPDHVFALDAILETYPDARFVFVHRDPTAVLPSLVKLTEVLRAPFTRALDKVAIGAEVSGRTAQGAERILAAAQSLPEARLLHLHFYEVTADPAGALEKLYGHFDLPFDELTRARVMSFVQGRPRGGYEINRYDPAEFGLELGRLRRQFDAYIEAFGAPPQRALGA